MFFNIKFNTTFKKINFDIDEAVERLENIQKKFNSPISAETYIRILNSVRKTEYYQEPAFYPYSTDNLLEVCTNSGWKFEEEHLNPEQALLLAIFGGKTTYKSKKEEFINTFFQFINEEKIGQQIEQAKQKVKKN